MKTKQIKMFNKLFKKAEKIRSSNKVNERVEFIKITKKMLCIIYSCDDLYFKDEMRNMLREVLS